MRRSRFQSTRPHGARLSGQSRLFSHLLFQSTRPHGARPRRRHKQNRPDPVSIHAPARGATLFFCRPSVRPPVSIHAPARGATRLFLSYPDLWSGFNPRARTGRDVPAGRVPALPVVFQSTRPHGARLDIADNIVLLAKVSIHAPARGATWEFPETGASGEVSIHAPARGATCHARQWQGLQGVSIHAPARGATRSEVGLCRITKVSIHAPARGATGGNTPGK